MNRVIRVFLSCKDSNPNGDPSDDNKPRQLPNDHGLITDVCVKSKIRQFARSLSKPTFGENYTASKASDIAEAKRDKAGVRDEKQLQSDFWDIKFFGAIVPKKKSEKTKKSKKSEDSESKDDESQESSIGLRGLVQLTNFVSVDPIDIVEVDEAPFPAKKYFTNGLYKGDIFISDENSDVKISEDEFDFLLKSLESIFTQDRSRNRTNVEVSHYIAFDQGFSNRSLWLDKTVKCEKDNSACGYKVSLGDVPEGKQVLKTYGLE